MILPHNRPVPPERESVAGRLNWRRNRNTWFEFPASNSRGAIHVECLCPFLEVGERAVWDRTKSPMGAPVYPRAIRPHPLSPRFPEDVRVHRQRRNDDLAVAEPALSVQHRADIIVIEPNWHIVNNSLLFRLFHADREAGIAGFLRLLRERHRCRDGQGNHVQTPASLPPD